MAKVSITVDIEQDQLLPLLTFLSKTSVSGTVVGVNATDKPAETPPAKAKPDETIKPAAPIESTKSSITVTQLKPVAAKLAKSGKREELKAIFAKYEASMLSEVKPEDYEALMKDLVAANE